jgi:hypothetical protein
VRQKRKYLVGLTDALNVYRIKIRDVYFWTSFSFCNLATEFVLYMFVDLRTNGDFGQLTIQCMYSFAVNEWLMLQALTHAHRKVPTNTWTPVKKYVAGSRRIPVSGINYS